MDADNFALYYWVTFAVTFGFIFNLPGKHMHGTIDNIIGTFLVSIFGFVLWPFAIIAARRAKDRK